MELGGRWVTGQKTEGSWSLSSKTLLYHHRVTRQGSWILSVGVEDKVGVEIRTVNTAETPTAPSAQHPVGSWARKK